MHPFSTSVPRNLGILTRPWLCNTAVSTSRNTIASRNFHQTPQRKDRSFTNLLADDNPPAVQVSSISEEGIRLADGLLIPGACIFLEGKVYLWDVPELKRPATGSPTSRVDRWSGWSEDRFQLLDVVAPRPEILILGTGKTLVQAPLFARKYLSQLGIQLDVMDTRNACSTYNLLAEEGRRVAAALLPITPQVWKGSEPK